MITDAIICWHPCQEKNAIFQRFLCNNARIAQGFGKPKAKGLTSETEVSACLQFFNEDSLWNSNCSPSIWRANRMPGGRPYGAVAPTRVNLSARPVWRFTLAIITCHAGERGRLHYAHYTHSGPSQGTAQTQTGAEMPPVSLHANTRKGTPTLFHLGAGLIRKIVQDFQRRYSASGTRV